MSATITFWKSNTCAKCAQVLPKLEKLAADAGVPVQVRNADDEPTAAQADDVRGFPTILLRDTSGQLVNRLEANLTMPQLRKLVADAGDLN